MVIHHHAGPSLLGDEDAVRPRAAGGAAAGGAAAGESADPDAFAEAIPPVFLVPSVPSGPITFAFVQEDSDATAVGERVRVAVAE
jgi:hypothetical protein